MAERTGGRHGQWFRFGDALGEAFCQTDVLLMLDGEVAILECKLTEVGDARRKLRELYVPVVQRALKRPTKAIVVARYLTNESDREMICATLGVALRSASAEYFPTLHWIGRGPI